MRSDNRLGRFCTAGIILASAACPAPARTALVMRSAHSQIQRPLTAAAGRMSRPGGDVFLSHIVAAPPGDHLPRSLFWSHRVANEVFLERGRVRVVLPAGALSGDYFLRAAGENGFRNPAADRDDLETANRKAEAHGGAYRRPVPGGLVDLATFDTQGSLMAPELAEPALISIGFEEDGKGFVKGMRPRVRSETLAIWILDTEKKMWRNLPDPAVDTEARRVRAKTTRLGTFALMGAPDFSLDQVIVYPVPWRPYSGNALTGTEAGGISFDLLPSECLIQIFTISGELVREIQHSGGDSVEKWDVRTPDGRAVASGLYVWLIKTPSGHRTGKLIVIR